MVGWLRCAFCGLATEVRHSPRAGRTHKTFALSSAVVQGQLSPHPAVDFLPCRACSGFIYMGIVLLTPAIGGGDGTTPECLADGTASWSNADFTAVMVTSVAEAPGMIVVMLLSDRIGRRW